MFYVYILKELKSGRPYIGYTANLKARLKQHAAVRNVALVYYEAYSSSHEARARERKLKAYGSAWRGLKRRIAESFNTKGSQRKTGG